MGGHAQLGPDARTARLRGRAGVVGRDRLARGGVAQSVQRRRLRLRWSPVGVASLAFGFFYPHFVAWPALLYASPLGVVPCATLYAIGGATLSGFAPRGAAYRWVIGLAALFYGAVGVFKLGVWIDFGLVVVHAMCIHDAHASLLHSHRARPRGLSGGQVRGAAVGVRAKFDHERANRSA